MIARTLMVFWCVVAALLLAILAWRDVNLLVSLVIVSGLLSATMSILGVRPRVVAISGAVPFITTFMMASVLAGDWGERQSMTSTCVFTVSGDVHIHHWLYGWLVTLACLVLMSVIRKTSGMARDIAVRRFGWRLLALAMAMLLALAICMSLLHATNTFWVNGITYCLYLAMLAAVCIENRTERTTFRCYVMAAMGMALGVLASGFLEINRDLLNAVDVPSGLIFWSEGSDPACH